jgi:hypothetical protein
MLRCVAIVRTDVSEELTRATRRNIPENAILHIERQSICHVCNTEIIDLDLHVLNEANLSWISQIGNANCAYAAREQAPYFSQTETAVDLITRLSESHWPWRKWHGPKFRKRLSLVTILERAKFCHQSATLKVQDKALEGTVVFLMKDMLRIQFWLERKITHRRQE